MIEEADHDWSVLLGQMVVAKQAVAEAAPRRLEPYSPPRAKATEAKVAAYEAAAGERLPDSYRRFLLYANGWPHFYFDMDLFGLDELSGGGQGPFAERLLDVYTAEEVLDELGWRRESLLPIAAGRGMRHLVVIVRSGRADAGMVSWVDGEEVARHPDFRAFFTDMTRFKLEQAQRLRRRES